MGSFSTSLSGLNAEEQALSVISNDLSNLNTTAFKTGTAVFSDLFYQMLGTDGAGDPVQLGVGATMNSVSSPMTQGSVSTTGVPTDVAVQGNGLFIVDHNGTQAYTRAGNFTTNTDGNLIDTNGNNVMGYAAVNGVINTSTTLSPIVISQGQTFPPNATSTVELDMNLDAADTSLTPAAGTLTVPAPTLPDAGQTATVGGTTYTFASSLSASSPANTVLIGSDLKSTLANLAGAIDASSSNGQAAGTTYSSGTAANPLVTATVTANVLSLDAVNTGAAGNGVATSTPWTAGSFAGADLSGGVNALAASGSLAVPPPLPTAGETIAVGGTAYTFATAITGQSAANTVLIGADVTSTLANLAGAINASSANGQAAGTTYSTGTVANAAVTATGSTATAVTLQAISGGVGGNALATTSQWAAGSFAGSDLTGGANALSASSTFTVPPGNLPNAGDTVDVGGTTYTFAAGINGASAANTVLIGPDTTSTLANLAGAINASSTNGQAAGTTFSTGTTANTSVTASAPTATTITFEAAQAGAAGNTLNTSASWAGGVDLAGGAVGLAATATLTVPAAGVPNVGDTLDVGGTTYTFAAAINGASPANTVLIGPDVSTTLSNLTAAINATPADSGVNFSSSTTANGSVTATGSTATSISLQALQTGVGGNTLSVSTSWNGGQLSTGTLAGGTNAATASGSLDVAIPLPAAASTVTVGGTTYTFAAAINGASPADTVLIGADVSSTLANLAAAINATPAGAGTTYSSGTVANALASATGTTATTVTLQARQTGTVGNNSIATSTSWTGGAFGAADLMGGVNSATATGAYSVPISLPTAGQTVTVGAATYTFVGSTAGLTAANDVLIGADVQSTLANLAGAIDASTTNGQGAGVTYGTGTAPNTAVTALGSTASALSLQAITSGSVGNSSATTTTWGAASFGSTDLTNGADAGTYSDSITVFDSLGNSHVLDFNFTKSASGDWNYQITIPAADVGATGAPQVVAKGALQFDSSGTLVSPSTNVVGKISGLADGAGTLGFSWTLFNSTGAPVITQTAETSTTSAKNQNGYGSGTLESYTIESSGIIQGVLSNDQTVSLGQIALATFPNYDGLTKLGSNDYQSSLASGAATVGAPGSGGRGTLEGGALEASNVDIATAFTELIQAERGYEANAKAITTADNVMQASIALIQG